MFEISFTLWNGGIFIVFMLLPNIYFFKSKFKTRMEYPGLELSEKEKAIQLIEGVLRIPVFVYPFFLSLKTDTSYLLPGFLVIVTGLLLYYYMWMNIFTTPLDKPVTKGLFRYSRHPGHLTPVVILIGISIYTSSLLYGFISLTFIFVHCLNSLSEERGEYLKYGEEYGDYCKKTPRWIGIPEK